MAAVLKTVGVKAPVGSNPTSSVADERVLDTQDPFLVEPSQLLSPIPSSRRFFLQPQCVLLSVGYAVEQATVRVGCQDDRQMTQPVRPPFTEADTRKEPRARVLTANKRTCHELAARSSRPRSDPAPFFSPGIACFPFAASAGTQEG